MLRTILLFSALAVTPVFAADLAPKKPATERSIDKSTTEDKTTTDEKTTKGTTKDKQLMDKGKFEEDCDPTKEVCPKKKDIDK
jgi:hypothetical protein